ncbi:MULTISPECIES: type IV pilin protein [Anoxybacillus]|uniref:type IV pilin protein n=1 Tax=Anoxybacillus TaxID=150247 RepID=UPI0007D91E02|nr:type II secretion system protein [Anoxybacillus flavithermus]MBE2911925.1 type II secretion system protein [Anoxybacillus flavithermus]MBE2923219.1 type II secretion system protein [Anoxybacillus flavithermus]MBE2931111.1 type II secretion system protein [Anoxybacillus flavithermus]OAO84994.1 Type IV pilin PilA [Anoxybacillus flavithermus]
MQDERGMTLIELLAVVVILSILMMIATISVIEVIKKSRDQAFVATAYSLYEAARLHVGAQKVEFLTPNQSETLTYKQLVDDGVFEPIIDPYTSKRLQPSGDSYVIVTKQSDGTITYAVCLKGETKQICEENGVPVDQLSVRDIQDRQDK